MAQDRTHLCGAMPLSASRLGYQSRRAETKRQCLPATWRRGVAYEQAHRSETTVCTHTAHVQVYAHVIGGHQTLAKRRQPTERPTTTSPWSTMMMAAFRRSRQRHDGSDDRVTK
jgi:hypothetical protein